MDRCGRYMNKIFCKNCNKELEENERFCSACGCPDKIYKVELTDTIKIRPSLVWKHRRPGFKKPIAEGVNRYKISRDPKLHNQEVHEVYVVDRIKKRWDQIIRDVTSGEIIHEEHKSLNEKNKNKPFNNL